MSAPDLHLLWDIYEEHLSEAAFLWSQWERALVAPDYAFSEVAEVEERLLAHLDGLALGGPPIAAKILKPALTSDEATVISSAAWVMAAECSEKEAAELIEVLLSGKPEQQAAIARALELSASQVTENALHPLLRASDAAAQTIGCDILAFRGALPREALTPLLAHADAKVRRAAIRAARAFPDIEPKLICEALAAPQTEIRNAALETGVIRGVRAAWDMCRKVVADRLPEARQAMVLLALGGTDKDLQLLLDMLQVRELRQDALWALGFSGRVQAADACCEVMNDEQVAALAGEAFSAITGLRIENTFAGERQEDGPQASDEDLDADLTAKPEDALPLPDQEAIARWWQEARKDFDSGTRYILGKPFGDSALLEALESCSMRRRHALALDLAIRSHGSRQIPTRALTHRQQIEAAGKRPPSTGR